MSNKPQTAIVLAGGMYQTEYAKVAHGLVRGPCRFDLVGVVDEPSAGQDAGALLDGMARSVPVFSTVTEALRTTRPDVCVMGVATPGGKFTPALTAEVQEALAAGCIIVNGLHQPLCEVPAIAALVRGAPERLIDIRVPLRRDQLHFWSGEITSLTLPRIAVLGTDCALGKRTTARWLTQYLNSTGTRAEMIYTGQTGWLQGGQYGFILDATPNDFVSGELEHAVLRCVREQAPDVILLEGQSSLRNPSGPCGSELILSAGATAVILQHAPRRIFHKGLEKAQCRIAPIEAEIRLIQSYGVDVWAVSVNEEGLAPQDVPDACATLQQRCGLPVFAPLRDQGKALGQFISTRLPQRAAK